MSSLSIQEAVDQINQLAGEFEVSELQAIRKEIKGFYRLPGKTIFSSKTTHDDWAFHHGGRSELQFNIGFEHNRQHIRNGIAFSFETSQTLPSIHPLLPKVRLFNEFITQNLDEFSDFRMWHFSAGKRSSDYMPSAIPEERAKVGTFVFVGTLQEASQFDPRQALLAFDRLLPLYKYTEGGGSVITSTLGNLTLEQTFKPGFKRGKSITSAQFNKETINVHLRHGEIQNRLYIQLSQEFGGDNVGGEIQVGRSGWADMVLKRGDHYTLYEVKTSHSARICIREAAGQLLEYAYWPNSTEPVEIVIVGEAEYDAEARDYLNKLRTKFSLPIRYLQVSI